MKPSISISRLLAVSVISLVGLSFIPCSAQTQAAGLPAPVRLPLWPEGRIPADKESEGDPNRIGLIGFSAGGHLGSTVITQIDAGNPAATDPVAQGSARPDFAILFYPVITLVEEIFVHKGSRSNLTGDDHKLWPEQSNELHVSNDTPPVFLIHGVRDKGVPPENSVMFAEACRKAGVSVELHVLSHGEHAFRNDAVRAESYECLQRWLGRNGWLR